MRIISRPLGAANAHQSRELKRRTSRITKKTRRRQEIWSRLRRWLASMTSISFSDSTTQEDNAGFAVSGLTVIYVWYEISADEYMHRLKTDSNIFDARCTRPRAVSVVRLSVTFVHWVEMSKHILKLFSPSAVHTTLVFLCTKSYGNTPTGPLTGRRMHVMYMKNRDFRLISRFILEMIQDRATVTIEHQQELVCDSSNGATSNDLEWPPDPAFKFTQLLDAEYLRNGTR